MPLRAGPHHGFSLIEILLALTLSLGALAFVKEPLMQTLQLHKLVKDRSVIQNLEDALKRSVNQNASFELALDLNPDLGACIRQDAEPCKPGRLPVDFLLAKGRPTTGLFGAGGEPCQGRACPIQIETQFAGICKDAQERCELAPAIEVEYRILVGGTLFKKGLIHRANANVVVADENTTCDVDDLGRSSFAHAIAPKKMNCLSPPRFERKITGIELGDCERISDILVGFAPDGKRICKAILRKNP